VKINNHQLSIKMTRQEKIKRVQEIENDIKDLKEFLKFLEYNDTQHPKVRSSSTMIERKITTSFLGLWKNERRSEIKIPKKLSIDISVLCLKWVEELEQECEKIIKSDEKV